MTLYQRHDRRARRGGAERRRQHAEPRLRERRHHAGRAHGGHGQRPHRAGDMNQKLASCLANLFLIIFFQGLFYFIHC